MINAENLSLGIRPEFIKVSREMKGGWPEMEVRIIEDTGAYKILTLVAGNTRIKARVFEGFPVREGERIFISFKEENIKIYRDGKLEKKGYRN